MSSKKKVRHDAIADPAVKRLLLRGAKERGVNRISAEAIVEAKRRLDHMLGAVAKECKQEMALRKRKTVDRDAIERGVLRDYQCKGLNQNSFSYSKVQKSSAGKAMRDLALQGVLKTFKGAGKLGDDFNIAQEAKDALLAVCNNYVVLLGSRSGVLAHAAGRQTLFESDIADSDKL